MNAMNFLKFLEDKRGKKLPFLFKIKHAPETITKEDLHVKGSLFLDLTFIERLPDNLIITGYLSIELTPMIRLPNNLSVGENLYMDDTPIHGIPEGLKIGGSLFARRVRFFKRMSEDDIKKMVEEKGGYIKGEIFR